MKMMTKMSAAALFALFLTACDKPATTADSEPAQNAVSAQVEPPKTEPQAVENTQAEDYEKFHEWQQAQEKAISEAIVNAMEKLGDKAKNDPAQIQNTMNKAILAQIEQIQQSASQLDIRDEKINRLKEKALAAMALGAKMITESEKLEKNPTPEAHKAFGELQAQLTAIAEEGQKIEAELAKKYAPEPAPQPQTEPASVQPEQEPQQ